MRAHPVLTLIVMAGTLTSWPRGAAISQELALADREPRFLYAPPEAPPVEIDASRSALLRRVVSLTVDQPTVGRLLTAIEQQTGLTFAYSPDRVPAHRPVTLRAESITVAAALTEILLDTGLDVVLSPGSHVAFVEARPRSPALQEGSITGRVTERGTTNPLIGATVVLDPTRRQAITDGEGRYRFANVPAGSYTVRARHIGYAPLPASVTVTAGREATVDFAMERAVHQLGEVVVTGTLVPTEVRAVPTPVSVITANDIQLQRPSTVQELFRRAVPGAVSWDVPGDPDQTIISVRGASTLELGSGQMKVFVDGLELASISRAAVDPNSIERIEVIRGPQAAAIYGSEAIGGVIQIFTKRGDPQLTRPQVDAQAALGILQTPYAGFDDVLVQNYTASARGGGGDATYNVGAGYSDTDDYLPNGEQSAQSSYSAYGGIQFARGIMSVDISGRFLTYNVPNVFNPELLQSGFFFFAAPFFEPVQNQSQTVGARLRVTPTEWWQVALTGGVDRATQDAAQSRPRLTTAEDTLLEVFRASQTKTSIGVNTSVQGALGRDLSGSLTVGIDHYDLPSDQFFTGGAINTTGRIRTDPNQPVFATRVDTKNTGYFAQGQLSFRDALFLTAGVRAEENTNFGEELGTPVSPRVGLSYARQVGGVTLKLRGSYGEAIRPPSPVQQQAGPFFVANPELGAEQQQGWDAGVDVAFGNRGALSVTYFDQAAEDLIQDVLVQPELLLSQFQNVGRVQNTGVEVEGTLALGLLRLKGQYAYVRARVEQLSPSYTGELRVGDQAGGTPKHTAGASLTFRPLPRTTVVGGLTYVGSWNTLDFLGYFRCLGGTEPCRNETFALDSSYVIAYPGFVKVNASVVQQLTSVVSGFVSVDNLTNNDAYEFLNNTPVGGRTTTVGVRVQY